MPLPKSVTKIITKQGKTSLTYTSNVDRCNYTMEQLIRRANLDVGRYITRLIYQKVRAISKFTGKGKYIPMRYQYWARKQENDLQIGVENTNKGAESAWWADQAELGTNGQPKRAFIHDTVMEHIDDIREIQSKYISAIEDEINAERLASEAENEPNEAVSLSNE